MSKNIDDKTREEYIEYLYGYQGDKTFMEWLADKKQAELDKLMAEKLGLQHKDDSNKEGEDTVKVLNPFNYGDYSSKYKISTDSDSLSPAQRKARALRIWKMLKDYHEDKLKKEDQEDDDNDDRE